MYIAQNISRKWWHSALVFSVPPVDLSSAVSRAQNNAERIFALMPEKNARSYCTMIRGMVKVPFFVYLYLIFFETGSLCNLNWMDEQTRLKLLKMSQPHYRCSTIPGKKNSFSLFRHISEIVCPALRFNKTSQNNWDPGHTLQYLVVILRNIFVSLCCLQPVKWDPDCVFVSVLKNFWI